MNGINRPIVIKAVSRLSVIEAILLFVGGAATGFYLVAAEAARKQNIEEEETNE